MRLLYVQEPDLDIARKVCGVHTVNLFTNCTTSLKFLKGKNLSRSQITMVVVDKDSNNLITFIVLITRNHQDRVISISL